MIDAQLMTTFGHDHRLGHHPRISLLKMQRGNHNEYVHNQELDRIFLLNRLPSNSTQGTGMRSEQLVITTQQSQYQSDQHFVGRNRRFQNGEFLPIETTSTTVPNSAPVSNCYNLMNKNPCDGMDYFYETEEDTCESESENEMMDDMYYDEDDDEDDDEYGNLETHVKPDDPSVLLNFVQNVTRDIQNLFARNKGMEDFCDVYEERFKTTLTGRELYYAELLALASNDDATSSGRGHKRNRSSMMKSSTAMDSLVQSPVSNGSNSPLEMRNTMEHTVIYGVDGQPRTCSLPHEGRCIPSYGLGPLEDLFRSYDLWKNRHAAMTPEPYSSHNFLSPYSAAASSVTSSFPVPQEFDVNYGLNKINSSGTYPSLVLPMNMRKLPNSFWEEPCPESKSGLLSVTRTPDFNDLFDQWTSEKC